MPDTLNWLHLQEISGGDKDDLRSASDGAVEASKLQGKINALHQGKSKFDTGDFSDRSPGNLRIDYVLPSRDLHIVSAGVFWPRKDQPTAALLDASDHRLVWLDIKSK